MLRNLVNYLFRVSDCCELIGGGLGFKRLNCFKLSLGDESNQIFVHLFLFLVTHQLVETVLFIGVCCITLQLFLDCTSSLLLLFVINLFLNTIVVYQFFETPPNTILNCLSFISNHMVHRLIGFIICLFKSLVAMTSLCFFKPSGCIVIRFLRLLLCGNCLLTLFQFVFFQLFKYQDFLVL